MPNLERLFKVFSDNQNKIEKIGGSNVQPYETKSYYNWLALMIVLLNIFI